MDVNVDINAENPWAFDKKCNFKMHKSFFEMSQHLYNDPRFKGAIEEDFKMTPDEFKKRNDEIIKSFDEKATGPV